MPSPERIIRSPTDPANGGWRASLKDAARVIHRGGVIAYPTESCFGIGCNPQNRDAIRRILAMKKRSRDKGLILVSDRYARFGPYLCKLPPDRLQTVLNSWPGPITWLWPGAAGLSVWLTGDHSSLAVRVTSHRPTALLCRMAATALVSTSANRAGQAALRSARRVRETFGDEIDFVLDAPIGQSAAPSRIVDVLTSRVFRS